MTGDGAGISLSPMTTCPPIIRTGINGTTVTALLVVLAVLFACLHSATADTREPEFPPAVTIGDKKLMLNGVGDRTYLWYRVITGGLYLERPTRDPRVVIESEQIKSLHEYFRPARVQALWIRRGVVRLLTDNNPEELVTRHREDIDRFVSWFDGDAHAGTKTVITYMPGTGLTLEYDGVLKGTIAGKEFARMYFRSIFGDEADKKTRKQFLGME